MRHFQELVYQNEQVVDAGVKRGNEKRQNGDRFLVSHHADGPGKELIAVQGPSGALPQMVKLGRRGIHLGDDPVIHISQLRIQFIASCVSLAIGK